MPRFKSLLLLAAVFLAAFIASACNSGGISGPGTGCDADVLPPTTFGRQYESDWNKCAGRTVFDWPSG